MASHHHPAFRALSSRTTAGWIPLALLILLCVTPGADAQTVQLKSSNYQSFTVVADTEYVGLIELENTTDQAQQMRIYQTDYLTYASGEVRMEAVGTAERSNAAWIDLPNGVVTLRPRSTIQVRYRIHLPAAAGGFAGTYWSAIMAEPVLPAQSGLRPSPITIQTN